MSQSSSLKKKYHGFHMMKIYINRSQFRGSWVAWLVKPPTLDFGSEHNLAVREFEPYTEPAWDSLSPPLSQPLPFLLLLSLKI